MKNVLCAGAIALAALGLLPAQTAHSGEYAAPQPMVTLDIGHIHGALHLTPQQEAYWPPVELALRDLARQQGGSESAGFVRRFGHRIVAIALNSAAVERLVAAARPLIAVLSDDQKRAASGMAQEMGLGPVLAALN